MKTLYLDLFSGISGDMFIGALLDLGVDFAVLEDELRKLGVEGYHLHKANGEKQSISGTKFDVHLKHPHEHGHGHHHAHAQAHDHVHEPEHDHEHTHAHAHDAGHEHGHSHDPAHSHGHHETRTFADIRTLFRNSRLSDWVKTRAIAVFERIAIAEGKIHGVPADQVHFHEVGAIDSIVDIAGACIALEQLGKPRVLASAVIEGTGFVKCAHGRFPIPAPATLAILSAREIPVSQCDEPHELVTPTGAALLAEFVEKFGPMDRLQPVKIGIGLGTRDNQTRPNVLRAILANEDRQLTANVDWEIDRICVIETNIDDLSPEILGAVLESCMAQGALDAYHTAIQMKKNRPGVLLTILCEEKDADSFSEKLLRETSAFGVRRTFAERRKLKREFRQVQTPYGEVSVKIGLLNGRPVQFAPEFESCRQVAQNSGASLREVYEAALRARKL